MKKIQFLENIMNNNCNQVHTVKVCLCLAYQLGVLFLTSSFLFHVLIPYRARSFLPCLRYFFF